MKKTKYFKLPEGENRKVFLQGDKIGVDYDEPERRAGVMSLDNNGYDLIIHIDGGGIIGVIDDNGRCLFLNNDYKRDNYKKWNGEVCSKPVIWKGNEIALSKYGILHSIHAVNGGIYCFKNCHPIPRCGVGAIVKYENNNTPILF